MNKILVAVDGSEGSNLALNKSFTLVSPNGEIILIAVVPKPSNKTFVDQEIFKKLKKKADELIKELIDYVKSHGLYVEGLVKKGDASIEIIDIASKLNVDLIMLGSKGASKLGDYPIGSVANKVVQYAHKPVMVVR
jgi:nucleotide-binding universal stress UspA family protein